MYIPLVSGDLLGTLAVRQDMQAWIKKNGVKNTESAYSTYQQQYLSFCTSRGLPKEAPEAIALFLREGMEERKLTASTLNGVAASAISDLFRYDKISPTLDPMVRATKKVIGRMAKKGPGAKRALPRHLLEDFVDIVDPKRLKDVRDILLFIMMFGGLFRGSEAAALKAEKVWVEEGNLYIFVEKSKVDQDCHGETIVLAGCPTSQLCPVTWFEIYNKERPDGEFLFHNISKPGQKLSAKRTNTLLKEWLKRAGVPKDERALFGSHSLRRGGATAAAAKKIRMLVLKRHGRWKSDAVYLYIMDSTEERLSVSRAVLGFD